MPLKNTIQPFHIPVNNYELTVPGLGCKIYFTSVEGLDEELETVDLPDRTARSGGNTKAGSFTAKQMMHHSVEVAALELWYKQSQFPVHPDYLKTANLAFQSLRLNGGVKRVYSIIECFPHKRVIPNAEMNDEGKAAEITWTFRFSQIKPVL